LRGRYPLPSQRGQSSPSCLKHRTSSGFRTSGLACTLALITEPPFSLVCGLGSGVVLGGLLPGPFPLPSPCIVLFSSAYCNIFIYLLLILVMLLTTDTILQRKETKVATMQATVVHIGDRLKRLRNERYLSQRELAKAAGLSPATIFKLENDLAEPHPSTIRKLAQALEVAPSELAPVQ